MRFFIFICLVSCFAKSIASDVTEENEIYQIKKHPEVIKKIADDKIYLNENFLYKNDEGIVLESSEGPIMLRSLNIDANGCYISAKLRRWRDYYFCKRCNIKFEKSFILSCPSCNKSDCLIFLGSEFE